MQSDGRSDSIDEKPDCDSTGSPCGTGNKGWGQTPGSGAWIYRNHAAKANGLSTGHSGPRRLPAWVYSKGKAKLGLTTLRAFLRRHRRVALDTSIFIYELEAGDRYATLADQVFKWIEEPGHSAVTSTVTMTELIVQPYRESDEDRVNEFYALLTTYPNLDWIAPDLAIADLAAQLRAHYRLRTPDAIQAATAARSQATGFITNDIIFQRVDAFETLLFDKVL